MKFRINPVPWKMRPFEHRFEIRCFNHCDYGDPAAPEGSLYSLWSDCRRAFSYPTRCAADNAIEQLEHEAVAFV